MSQGIGVQQRADGVAIDRPDDAVRVPVNRVRVPALDGRRDRDGG